MVEPDDIHNLGAQSQVAVSFQQPEYTADVDGLGVIRLLEAIRDVEVETRLYQAGTSEMFGDAPPPQSEATLFQPRSPYAAAKLYGYWVVRNYREAYDTYACSLILFDHESPRRGETFVTRKITRSVARIVAGLEDTLYLGNLNAKRDWGHARDYVRAMWMMLQQDVPTDYVVGMGGDPHGPRDGRAGVPARRAGVAAVRADRPGLLARPRSGTSTPIRHARSTSSVGSRR